MLPSMQSNDAPEPSRIALSPPSALASSQERHAVVFRVVRLTNGTWLLETTGGEVGGIFASKHAALAYACTEAEYCPAKSVLIELAERRPESDAELGNAFARPAATGT